MNWESKVKLIQLGNKMNSTEKDEDKKEFQVFVLNELEKFDSQAFDMFSNIVILDSREMVHDIKFWTKVYEKIKHIDCNSSKFSFSSAMRIAMIQQICESKLNLS